jgi:hypothetical protein
VSLGFGGRAERDSGPRDLHELLAILAPFGWVRSNGEGLWREGYAMWVSPIGFGGEVEAHGDGLRYEGPLWGVVPYLRSKGVVT